jgi:hypothetical protein
LLKQWSGILVRCSLSSMSATIRAMSITVHTSGTLYVIHDLQLLLYVHVSSTNWWTIPIMGRYRVEASELHIL